MNDEAACPPPLALPHAVILGLSPTGLHVVRALGRHGVRVTGVGEGIQPGRFSRHLARFLCLADAGQRLETLCRLFPPADGTRPVLIPTSDRDVEFIIAHAETLGRHFAFQRSYRDGTAAAIMAKDSFHTLCENHGVRVPRTRAVPLARLASLAGELPFPCLLKPALIHEVKHLMHGRKAWIARDAAQFRAIAAAMPRGIGTVIVQDVVPGPESAITLYCAHVDEGGVPQQPFTARKLRQYPPGFGSASLAQGHPEPETARLSEALLAATGYRGIAALEFKRHATNGQLYIIEMNVRPSLWFALTAASGRDVVLSAYRELAGIADAGGQAPQRDGVRWRYRLKDMASAAFYRRDPGFVLPAADIEAAGPASARVGAVFDPSDPAPVLGELLTYAAKAARRVAGRRTER